MFQLSCLTSFYKHDYTHRHNCNYCIYYNLLLYILFLTHLSKLSRLVGCYAGIDNFLNITIHNLIKLIKCKTYSMVCYTSLWEVVSSYLLSSVSSTYLASCAFCVSRSYNLALKSAKAFSLFCICDFSVCE